MEVKANLKPTENKSMLQTVVEKPSPVLQDVRWLLERLHVAVFDCDRN